MESGTLGWPENVLILREVFLGITWQPRDEAVVECVELGDEGGGLGDEALLLRHQLLLQLQEELPDGLRVSELLGGLH